MQMFFDTARTKKYRDAQCASVDSHFFDCACTSDKKSLLVKTEEIGESASFRIASAFYKG